MSNMLFIEWQSYPRESASRRPSLFDRPRINLPKPLVGLTAS
jgi:hypothetical protein